MPNAILVPALTFLSFEGFGRAEVSQIGFCKLLVGELVNCSIISRRN